jgi:hypothetical protein
MVQAIEKEKFHIWSILNRKEIQLWMGKDSALDRKEVSTRECSAQDRKRVKFQSTIRGRFGFRMGKILKRKGKDLHVDG